MKPKNSVLVCSGGDPSIRFSARFFGMNFPEYYFIAPLPFHMTGGFSQRFKFSDY